MVDWLRGIGTATVRWVEKNKQLIVSVAKIGAAVAVGGAAIAAFGLVLKGVAVAVGLGVSALGAFAVAMKAVAAASALFAAGPLVLVLAGVAAAAAGLCYWLNKSADDTGKLTAEMAKLRQEGDKARQADKLRMERLEQLSRKTELHTKEQAEARKIIETLTGRYGAFGASIDATTGKITLAADAWDNLTAAMKRNAEAELKAELRAADNEYETVSRDLEAEHAVAPYSVSSWVFGSNINSLTKKQQELYAKRQDLMDRLRRLRGGDEDAITGIGEEERLRRNVFDIGPEGEEGLQARKQREQEAERMSDRLAAIDKQYARDRRTALENEIADIRELNEERKKLLWTLLEYEKNKEGGGDFLVIGDLERRLADADRQAAERIARAERKASEAEKKAGEKDYEYQVTDHDIRLGDERLKLNDLLREPDEPRGGRDRTNGREHETTAR